ncbi:MAG TPA: Stk1 family PASTA domain-containing Ser/Thr kinase [Propionibacteriaceae bacterium]|nr:Stk1 family PASTA domain-containing Ser/Thr kinase [Propionibacteriaceae bacterium]
MTSDPKTVGGRYELGDLLGRGGMAEVRYAVDRRLGRPVAVKQLRTDLASDPTFQARFRREAQSAAGLNHPTIVSVYDTGEEPDPRTGVSIPYIVMELVEGQTLRDILREGRKILPERALELTSGVLDALSYSHKAGIVHRDIKPANVMLTPNGGVKVMDFGIARAIADTSATMTQTAAVIGTAQYLSPEQARGETVDARSDIYSAGCLLYELLVGRPPFTGDSPVSVAYQHVRETPVTPSQLDPVISPDIDAITLKALAKDPADRYQSAREMKADIARVLAGHQATAMVPAVTEHDQPTRVVPAVAAPTAVHSAITTDTIPPEEPRRRVGLMVLVTGLILIALAGAGYAIYTAMQGQNTPAAVETVEVPSVIGFSKASAESTLRNAQLVPRFRNVNGRDDDTVNTATKQSPLGNEQAPVNSTVTVEINAGPRTATVPDGLLGSSVDDAKDTLESADFKVKVVPAGRESADARKDQVLVVSPSEGESVPLGSEITLTVATGESIVPNFLGSSRQRAEADARAAGFGTPRFVEKESTKPSGTVIEQNPEPGRREERGKELTLTVAIPKEEPTPTAPATTAPPAPTAAPTTSQPTAAPSTTATPPN